MTQTLTWEYANGSTMSFITDNAKLQVKRIIYEDTAVDGTITVTDTDKYQRILTFNTVLSPADCNTLHDLLIGGTIDYTSAYPTITYTWSSGVTEKWEVWEEFTFSDQANNYRNVSCIMREKT